MEDAMYERFRRLTAGRPIIDPDRIDPDRIDPDRIDPDRRRDLVYRPVWRPTEPDQLDALIIDAAS